ncbi:hypothetical protein AAIR98_001341 [Elusimicrobium simillimum]|uniref:hypothetical protein n=1 Tax=Elusimicrobium simillimum TaxID=3143438 RepID=UPI003C705748
MPTGYIKLYRQIEDNKDIWEDKNIFNCFTKLLLVVNRNNGVYESGVKPLALRLGLGSRNTLKKALDKLKELGCVEYAVVGNKTRITVTNYYMFQKNKYLKNEQSCVQKTNTSPPCDVAIIEYHTKQNLNKDRSKNKHPIIGIEEIKDKLTNKETKKEAKVHKLTFGEFNNIKLTEKEYSALIGIYGEERTNSAINYLSSYKEEKGYKSKNDNLTLRRWVFSAIDKQLNGGSYYAGKDYNREKNFKYERFGRKI